MELEKPNFFEKVRPEKKEINPLKSEHLKEGFKPIMASVASPGQIRELIKEYKDEIAEKILIQNNPKSPDVTDVKFFGNPFFLRWIKKLKNGGPESYVISSVDNRDKYSSAFRDCLGLAAVGCEKTTGRNISFLLHINPDALADDKSSEKFNKDFSKTFDGLKERSLESSLDIVIFGGNYFIKHDKPKIGDYAEKSEEFRSRYKNAVLKLSEQVKKISGLPPVILTGPKVFAEDEGDFNEEDNYEERPEEAEEIDEISDDVVFLKNDERRLYIMRPKVGVRSTESFLASQLEEQEKKWQEEGMAEDAKN